MECFFSTRPPGPFADGPLRRFYGNTEGGGQTLYYNQLAKINPALGITALVVAFVRQLSTGTLRPDMGKLPLTLTAPNDVDSARRLIVAPKRPEVHY